MGTVRIGVAGWVYPDWAGIVYPSPPGARFDRLSFLSRFFDLLEINVTFYRQPDTKMTASWAARVAALPAFRFTAKLNRIFTHEDGASRRGAAAMPPEPAMPAAAIEAAARQFRGGIDPLAQAGLLGALLFQFPQSFHDSPASRRRLERLVDLFSGLPLVAEFRHRDWGSPAVLRWLERLGVGFCNIDQPDLGSTLGPTAHVTSSVAYVRLHGRNRAHWFGQGGAASRYDYLYRAEELRPWVDRIQALAGQAEEVFVVANNHYRGKAAAAGVMLKAALAGKPVAAPATLVLAYPELEPVVAPASDDPVQRRLF